MSKHIPLPLERVGTRIFSADVGLNRSAYVCTTATVEQAEEIITALEMHTPMKEALESALSVGYPDNGWQARAEAALTYPQKKETTP